MASPRPPSTHARLMRPLVAARPLPARSPRNARAAGLLDSVDTLSGGEGGLSEDLLTVEEEEGTKIKKV